MDINYCITHPFTTYLKHIISCKIVIVTAISMKYYLRINLMYYVYGNKKKRTHHL